VLYQAGVDALAEDRLGRLAVTGAGLEARDRFVLDGARAAGVPIVLTLGGGYAQPLDPTIDAHVTTYRVAYSLLAMRPS
jgi:acetoin utilization deacetylase AcuC-like enzyme